MNTFSHSSTGCAVLSADVAVGHLGAYLDHASELSCMVESPGDLTAHLAGQGLLSALVAHGALSAHIGGHAQLAASIGDRARLRASVVCEIGEIPYLEIEPSYIWIIPEAFVVTEPKYVTRRVVDSVPYPVTDTIRMRDTLFVLLEREQVTWEDSLARVYASGVNPHVDSVIHFTQEMVITKEIPVIQVKKTRWGIGVQAGAGVGKDGLTPYVGVGVSYNILSW